jgi:hypothetical protein
VSWDAIGAIGELVGALVVVVSVVYLAIQLRQSNKHAEASSEVAWFDGWNNVLNGWISDDDTMTAIRTGLHDFDQLSKSQQAIFHMRIGTMVNHWVLAGNLCDKGLLSRDHSDRCTDFVPSVLSTPGGLQYWEKDAFATPRGPELLELLKSSERSVPPISDVMPWWSVDDD